MNEDIEEHGGIPTIRVRAVGDIHATTLNIPIGAVLKVDGMEVL